MIKLAMALDAAILTGSTRCRKKELKVINFSHEAKAKTNSAEKIIPGEVDATKGQSHMKSLQFPY